MAHAEMTGARQQRICAVRTPGSGRARFADAGDLDVTLGDWVAVQSPAGIDAAQIVVAPDQWISPVSMDDAYGIIRVLEEHELSSMEGSIQRALGLIDQVADALRSINPDLFLCGLRFTLDRKTLLVGYIGERPDDPEPIESRLEQVFDVPVVLEQENAGHPDDIIQVGGTGRSTATRPETFSELLRERIDVLREPGSFAPQGLPRLGESVSTPDGRGRLVAVDIRHWMATVILNEGGEITVSVDHLGPPG